MRDPSTPPLTAQAGASLGARTRNAAGEARGGPRRKGEPLGYKFEPVPSALYDAVDAAAELPVPPREADPERERQRRRMLDDRLRSVDLRVMRILLRFPRTIRHVCWTTVETIAKKIRKCPRTVQYSLRRLDLHGFIERVSVDNPDPDVPQNKTRSRIVLLWLAPEGYRRGDGPDRRPPKERKRKAAIQGGGMQPVASPPLPQSDAPVASPPMQSVASAPMQPVASNSRAGASNGPDGRDSDGETPPSSSSPRAGEDLLPAGVPEINDDDSPSRSWEEEVAEAAAPFFGGDIAKAKTFAREKALDASVTLGDQVNQYPHALRKAAKVKKGGPTDSDGLHAYSLTIVRNGSVSAGGPQPLIKQSGAASSTAESRLARWEAASQAPPGARIRMEARTRAMGLRNQLEGDGWEFRLQSDGKVIWSKKHAVAVPIEPRLPELQALNPFLVEILKAELEEIPSGAGLSWLALPSRRGDRATAISARSGPGQEIGR